MTGFTAPLKVPMSVQREGKRLLKLLKEQADAEPFLAPVDWKAWGLDDYPIIVKHPMDLSKVERRLDDGEYDTLLDFARDVNLIWANCMLYNQDDSEYYKQANRMKRLFAEKLSPLLGASDSTDDARVPTQAEKKAFSQAIYVISPEELGKVVKLLDDRCPTCIRKIDPDDIEVDIDAIDPSTFWAADKFVKECVQPGSQNLASKGAKKRVREEAGPAAAPKRA